MMPDIGLPAAGLQTWADIAGLLPDGAIPRATKFLKGNDCRVGVANGDVWCWCYDCLRAAADDAAMGLLMGCCCRAIDLMEVKG